MSATIVRLSDRRPAPAPHPADVLSFMRRRRPKGGGIDYWTVEASGDYWADCQRGRELAWEYGSFIGRHPTGGASLLQCIVQDMLRRPHVAAAGRLSGVEIVFLSAVGSLAVEGAKQLADA